MSEEINFTLKLLEVSRSKHKQEKQEKLAKLAAQEYLINKAKHDSADIAGKLLDTTITVYSIKKSRKDIIAYAEKLIVEKPKVEQSKVEQAKNNPVNINYARSEPKLPSNNTAPYKRPNLLAERFKTIIAILSLIGTGLSSIKDGITNFINKYKEKNRVRKFVSIYGENWKFSKNLYKDFQNPGFDKSKLNPSEIKYIEGQIKRNEKNTQENEIKTVTPAPKQASGQSSSERNDKQTVQLDRARRVAEMQTKKPSSNNPTSVNRLGGPY